MLNDSINYQSAPYNALISHIYIIQIYNLIIYENLFNFSICFNRNKNLLSKNFITRRVFIYFLSLLSEL